MVVRQGIISQQSVTVFPYVFLSSPPKDFSAINTLSREYRCSPSRVEYVHLDKLSKVDVLRSEARNNRALIRLESGYGDLKVAELRKTIW